MYFGTCIGVGSAAYIAVSTNLASKQYARDFSGPSQARETLAVPNQYRQNITQCRICAGFYKKKKNFRQCRTQKKRHCNIIPMYFRMSCMGNKHALYNFTCPVPARAVKVRTVLNQCNSTIKNSTAPVMQPKAGSVTGTVITHVLL